MFWKKKKPGFPLRQPYSIREELEILNPFVRRDQIGAMEPYTMEDIRAAEKRLHFELPAPIRDLYLVMGDYMCLQEEFYFRALELLRWDGNYLLLAHGASDNIGFGLKRNDANATVYEWVCSPAITAKEDENDQRSYFHFESDFELCRHKGDTAGMAAAVNGYFDFWEKKKRRSEITRFSKFQNMYAPFTFFWDAFILRFVLRRMVDDADHLDKSKMTDELDQCYFSNDLPRQTAAMREIQEGLVSPFVPISSHMECIIDKRGKGDFYHILAYINKEEDCLLLMHPDAKFRYYLLTKEPVPYSLIQQVERKTGLLFYSRNGNGKEKALARRKEMEAQGLFIPEHIT